MRISGSSFMAEVFKEEQQRAARQTKSFAKTTVLATTASGPARADPNSVEANSSNVQDPSIEVGDVVASAKGK